MMPRCLPPFPLNPTYCSGADNNWRLSRWPEEVLFESNTVWEEMSFEEFQYSCHGGHLGYQNNFSNSESLCGSDASHRFGWIGPTLWEDRSFEEFQDGGHLWYQNGISLAILNLYNAPMPPVKFWLNLTYGLGGDVVWRISRWPLGGYLSYRNGMIFSNSEYLCPFDASHQVLLQSNLRSGRRCCLKNFKMVTMAAILDIRTERF